MSTTSGRVVAATVAAIIAVLTGITVGLISPHVVCRPAAAAPTTPASAAVPEPTASVDGSGRTRIGEADPRQPLLPGQPPARTTEVPQPESPPQSQPQSQQAAAVAATDVCTAQGGFEAGPAMVALVGALGAGGTVLVLLLLVGGRRRGAPPAPRGVAGPAAPTPGPASGSGSGGSSPGLAEADRAGLVQACIYVRDRTTSKALAERLGMALHDAGVTTIEPAGARFDPALHEAGGATASDDPAKVGTIAAVEVPGYADRGRLLRAPVVTVYQAGNGRHVSREER